MNYNSAGGKREMGIPAIWQVISRDLICCGRQCFPPTQKKLPGTKKILQLSGRQIREFSERSGVETSGTLFALYRATRLERAGRSGYENTGALASIT
jgi:hypothetical protein